MKTNTIDINEWIESLEKFQDSFDRQLLLKLIDKIIVHEKDKEAKIQNIFIYYKYIGIFERTVFYRKVLYKCKKIFEGF